MASEMSKGVMLCERPSDAAPPKPPPAPASESQAPFLSACAPSEQLGLQPVPKETVSAGTKKDSALSRHKKWLSEQEKMEREKREEKQLTEEEEIRKKEKLAEFSANLRASIMAGKDVSNTWQAAQLTKILRSKATQAAKTENDGGEGILEDTSDIDAEMAALVEDSLAKMPAKQTLKKKKNLPAWAMTEEAFEDREDDEAEDLINFVEDLDYDKYIESCDDEDLRKALESIKQAEESEEQDEDAWKKSFVTAMNNLASRDVMMMDDGDSNRAYSVAPSSQAADRARAAAASKQGQQKEWDSSTKGGDDNYDAERLDAAKYLLLEDPDLKKMHTTKSLAKIMEGADNKVEVM